MLSIFALCVSLMALYIAVRSARAVHDLANTVTKIAETQITLGSSVHKLADAYLVAIAPTLPTPPEENT